MLAAISVYPMKPPRLRHPYAGTRRSDPQSGIPKFNSSQTSVNKTEISRLRRINWRGTSVHADAMMDLKTK